MREREFIFNINYYIYLFVFICTHFLKYFLNTCFELLEVWIVFGPKTVSGGQGREGREGHLKNMFIVCRVQKISEFQTKSR